MRNRTRNNVIMLAPSLTVMEMSCTYQPDSWKHKATSINLATNQNEYQPHLNWLFIYSQNDQTEKQKRMKTSQNEADKHTRTRL
jgi:hypothetical protein